MKDTKLPRKRRRRSPSYYTKRQRLSAHNPYQQNSAQQQAVKVDFCSNELMQGPPNHTAEDFEQPRLRKCPFPLDAIKWESVTKLGDGYDGCVWKVTFGDQGTFVLKVFWDLQPPQAYNSYFAPQRECQNAAILQMIEAVLEEGPVPLPFEHPETQAQATANMLAFSVPRNNMQQFPAAEGPQVVLSQFPPIRRCYGWIDFNGDLIKRMPAIQPVKAILKIYINKALGAEGAWETVSTPEGVSYTRSLRIFQQDPSYLLISGAGHLPPSTTNNVTLSVVKVN
ncbi:hypothetical protein O1611_g7095 [Lasiodiplodia mahajangana]|uniref:Uncharacterized protein n=1 Tax=Lasiodiplodia mahajangana TaxID=1108764 RepID=A0ACC2JGQ0_9PEZI|nr:hypothetical protein O1611_g7095 [Lasiodiplodia mahajangana]